MKNIIGFTEEECDIIECYFEKKMSIREISATKKGYGRTKIRNIINKYAKLNEENRKKAELMLYRQKTHKKIESPDDINQADLTEEQIISAYRDIVENDKTLTEVSASLDKNRETVKKAILEYLNGDNEAIKEFKQILKDNQASRGKHDFDISISKEEKLERIFNRLNYRRRINNRVEYPINMLERKANRLFQFFEKRNDEIENENGKITEEQLLKMLYDCPTLLSISFNDKLRPALMVLENNKSIGKENASRIIRENPSILGCSIKRTKLQLKILEDTNTLPFVLDKPRILRTSPELLYSQIKLWENKRRSSTPFVSSRKLYEIYGKTPDEIQKEFNAEAEYGDDEYFDRM